MRGKMFIEVCKLLTIHFFKSSSKVSRVGKAYESITLCFSSSLISNNLDKINDTLITTNYKENTCTTNIFANNEHIAS